MDVEEIILLFYFTRRQDTDNKLRLDSFEDLGATFQLDLSFKNNITEKINKVNSMLGIIKKKL